MTDDYRCYHEAGLSQVFHCVFVARLPDCSSKVGPERASLVMIQTCIILPIGRLVAGRLLICRICQSGVHCAESEKLTRNSLVIQGVYRYNLCRAPDSQGRGKAWGMRFNRRRIDYANW